MPAGITRSAPAAFEVTVEPARRKHLHRFLAGISVKFLDELLDAAVSARSAYMQPALVRDRQAAAGFFAAGPKLVRSRRIRHGVPDSVLDPETYRALVTREIQGVVGAFVSGGASTEIAPHHDATR